jgi:hypothetical protein
MQRISYSFYIVYVVLIFFLLPILPLSFNVPYANAASVTLAWDPNSDPDIIGYNLYYGKASGIYESVIDVGNQTTYSIYDLEDAETYYFVVTAYNTSGFESDFSSELRYPEPFSVTIPLVEGMNLISLPLEPLNPTPAVLTERLSPCLLQVFASENDTVLYYDPSQLDQNTLTAIEPGKGYWVEMACPGEMTVVGNRTTRPINLSMGENHVGYNSLIPLPVSEALASIVGKYSTVWAYKDNEWTFYDPADEIGSTLQVLVPGNGYRIEVIEETTWTLPYY